MQPLQERQLLQMNRESLEKRILQYYNETKNEDVVIEYGMALLARNAMVMDDYSFICKDLIRTIFLEGKPNNTKRDFCLYFYDFFDYSEWEIVRTRLFKTRSEFSEWTRAFRPDTTYVRAAAAPTYDKFDEILTYATRDYSEKQRADAFADKENFDFLFKAYFSDANGKKHLVTFKHADISKSGHELYILLEILTKLTIFEKDGVRRFKEILGDDCMGVVKHSLVRSKKKIGNQ
ncbi:hypothetical protein [Candidatus Enterococcus murrayae]|uniref:Uncharacterized protein n=1 Tax=Candidatus Enterococcus murrayae TaxID=2815321 RepID=A0ABS3HM54_9ENTE|nr:hypothetical protein [Enterococcus sp. MJM16]MBO0454537.1 hypothetical protein [Enterococcus sp. MJM16]